MRRTDRVAHRIATALACGILLVGCGGGGTPEADPDLAEAPRATSPAVGERVRADSVNVVLEEYLIAMPGVIASGPTILRISNRGVEEHNLQLRDAADSLVWRTEENLSPGETLVVRLELEPGTYAVLCRAGGDLGAEESIHAPLHLLGRDVLDARRDDPFVSERVTKPARPVAVELVVDGNHLFRSSG